MTTTDLNTFYSFHTQRTKAPPDVDLFKKKKNTHTLTFKLYGVGKTYRIAIVHIFPVYIPLI